MKGDTLSFVANGISLSGLDRFQGRNSQILNHDSSVLA